MSLSFRSLFIAGVLLLLISFSIRAQQTLPITINKEKLKAAQQTEQEAVAKKDSLLLAEAYYLYGKVYRFAGNDLTSEQYFLKSLRILEPKGDSFELGRLYIRLCENYKARRTLEERFQYVKKAIGIFERVRSDKGLITGYAALGQLYSILWEDIDLKKDKAKYHTILNCFKKAAYFSRRSNDTLGIGEAYTHLGELNFEANDPQAISSFKQAMAIYEQQKKYATLVNTMTVLGHAYLHFGMKEQSYVSYKKAEELYHAHQLNSFVTYSGLVLGFLNYYKSTGQWQQAFGRLNELYSLEKNQFIPERDAAIAKLHIEYETQKKEVLLKNQQKELELRAQNERNQRLFIIIGSILLIIAVGASIAFYRLFRKNQRISHQKEELIKEQNHRVKNNLQVVSSLLNLQARQLTDETAKKAITDSQLRVQSMAILHRKLYDGDELAKVYLPDFILEVVEEVLKSFGCDAIRPTFDIAAIYLHADKAVPLGLILNELITNACKYAFPVTESPALTVRCNESDAMLQVRIVDNGPGLPKSENNGTVDLPKKSFGMRLIKSQTDKLRATYHFENNKGAVFTMMFKV